MYHPSYLRPTTRESIIAKEQTGRAEPTLAEQIDFLSREIEKKENSFAYYYSHGFKPLADSMAKTISHMVMNREILKAQQLAETIPFYGGKMQFAKVEK